METIADEIFRNIYIYRPEKEVLSIILVGSNSGMGKKLPNKESDLDLFVITRLEEFQERKIVKSSDGKLELDINFFSNDMAQRLIESGEFFIIKELAQRAQILQDTENVAKRLVEKAKKSYNKGPDPMNREFAIFEAVQLKSLIERINEEQDPAQNKFTRICIFYRIIKAYFGINGIWLPKEKHILKELKNISPELYSKSSDFLNDFDVLKLEEIYEEVFEGMGDLREISLTYGE